MTIKPLRPILTFGIVATAIRLVVNLSSGLVTGRILEYYGGSASTAIQILLTLLSTGCLCVFLWLLSARMGGPAKNAALTAALGATAVVAIGILRPVLNQLILAAQFGRLSSRFLMRLARLLHRLSILLPGLLSAAASIVLFLGLLSLGRLFRQHPRRNLAGAAGALMVGCAVAMGGVCLQFLFNVLLRSIVQSGISLYLVSTVMGVISAIANLAFAVCFIVFLAAFLSIQPRSFAAPPGYYPPGQPLHPGYPPQTQFHQPEPPQWTQQPTWPPENS